MSPRATGGPLLYGSLAAELRRRIARGVYAPRAAACRADELGVDLSVRGPGVHERA